MGTKGAQRVHKGGTSAGVDACVGSTVKVRVKHVIDRGGGAQSTRQGRSSWYGEGGEGIEKKNNSPRRTVITPGVMCPCVT